MSDIVLAGITGDALTKKAEWLAARDSLLDAAKGVQKVENDSELNGSGLLQTEITKLIKELEKARMALTRPLDDVKKQIMGAEKEMTDELNTEHARLKAMNNSYATMQMRLAEAEQRRIDDLNRKQAQEAAEAQRKLDEENEEKQRKAQATFGFCQVVTPPEPVAVKPVPVYVPSVTGPSSSANTITKVWKFEIVDSKQVPREFCDVDEKKIRAFLAYQKSMGVNIDSLQVAGLRLYAEANVGAR